MYHWPTRTTGGNLFLLRRLTVQLLGHWGRKRTNTQSVKRALGDLVPIFGWGVFWRNSHYTAEDRSRLGLLICSSPFLWCSLSSSLSVPMLTASTSYSRQTRKAGEDCSVLPHPRTALLLGRWLPSAPASPNCWAKGQSVIPSDDSFSKGTET